MMSYCTHKITFHWNCLRNTTFEDEDDDGDDDDDDDDDDDSNDNDIGWLNIFHINTY